MLALLRDQLGSNRTQRISGGLGRQCEGLERLRTEEQLIADVTERGWAREVERHRCIADRIRSLLEELDVATPANS